MRSFLFSILAKKFQPTPLAAFQAAHPHCWLVWEPGDWKPPDRSMTMIAAPPTARTPASGGEALAIALELAKGKDLLTVGRGSGSDIEINDGTLSQTHLVLALDSAGRWQLGDAGSRNGTRVNGVRLQPRVFTHLTEGARVEAARVTLTFHFPAGLYARLASWRR